jgi:hypothetical protein
MPAQPSILETMSPENGSAPPSNQEGAIRPSKVPAYVKAGALELVIAGLRLVEMPFEIVFWQIHGLRTRLEVALMTLSQ